MSENKKHQQKNDNGFIDGNSSDAKFSNLKKNLAFLYYSATYGNFISAILLLLPQYTTTSLLLLLQLLIQLPRLLLLLLQFF